MPSDHDFIEVLENFLNNLEYFDKLVFLVVGSFKVSLEDFECMGEDVQDAFGLVGF